MRLLIIALLIPSSFLTIYAQERKQDDRLKALEDAVDAAVKKACEWLKSQQQDDGHWKYNPEGPFKLDLGEPLFDGSTALVLYALLKGGVDPNEECIRKGFAYIKSRPFKYTYSVSCYILALGALYEAQAKKYVEKKMKKKGKKWRTEVVRYDPKSDFKRWPKQDRQAMIDAVEWLVKNRTNQIWRYPPNGEDVSNTQYATLALAVAQKFGVPVPDEVYVKIAEYFTAHQEKDGPEVEWFPVPAANKPMRELQLDEKKIEKLMKKKLREAKKMGLKVDRKQLRTAVVEAEREKVFGGERRKMFARGWCYMWNDTQGMIWRKMITGSMTTSGVVALIVCKWALENKPVWRRLKDKVEQSILDGCAWLAHHFTIHRNPVGKLFPGGKDGKSPGRPALHHYYYLFGLERVGMLGLIPAFGKHYWWEEGTKYLLGAQKPDGSWDAGSYGTSGPIPDTCWAILFMKKATAPLVDVPGEYTGEGLLPNRGK